ncbi:MAG: hypothetical protein ACE5I7_00395, partial [Candidatus Binatia bacterium]
MTHRSKGPRLAGGIVGLCAGLLLASGATLAAAAMQQLPGAPPYPPALQSQLHAALAAKGSHYVPRTRYLNPDGSPQYTNRLVLTS